MRTFQSTFLYPQDSVAIQFVISLGQQTATTRSSQSVDFTTTVNVDVDDFLGSQTTKSAEKSTGKSI